ncbi:MAG: CCA tRNA nucleotidyltransferase [Actinobacteria bacterium]|nr:CCA tRNA nucleotidyltransferase [Actinomycetota bacterium]MSW36492.1 CCA tRNA nucleotidyltransferase [Actinomycetota bacterium]
MIEVATAVRALEEHARVALDLGRRFADAGHELALVGGPVRDALLGRLGDDLDLTTDARPEQVLELVRDWADAVWDVGIAFGTVGLRKGDHKLEITTYRAEAYDRESRKPDVHYGTSLADDLGRRDFTVNAMAVRLPGLELVDLHGGIDDLRSGILRTPGTPESSFSDDPLRMMRAARFASSLGFEVAPEVVTAMTAMCGRLAIVSAERVRDELVKLVLGEHPRAGLALLVSTGLAELVLPELPALVLEVDEHHRHKDVYEHTLTVLEQAMDLETSHDPRSGPDFVLRFAALMHDVGKPRTRKFESDGGVSFHHHEMVGARITRKRMQTLRFPNDITDEVSLLVELHLRFHGYGDGDWTDSAVRRYVRDSGAQLARLHKLTRADCTTRNRRKAEKLASTYDGLEERIERLSAQEELDSIRPALDGNAIMAILGISPGREVGQAYSHLLELRLDHGPMSEDQAAAELRAWWAARGPALPPPS